MFRDIFVSLAFEILFVWVVEIRRDLDPYKASLSLGFTKVFRLISLLLVKGTWLREDQALATLIGCKFELVVLMRSAFDVET